VRTIAIATVVLVAAAAGITQKAIEAPRPAGVSSKTDSFVQQVACASAKTCAAIGTWLYTDQAGKWKAGKVPVLSGTGGTNVRSVACAAAGKCAAVGLAGEQHVIHLSENGREWKAGGVALPSDAAPVAPPGGPSPSLTSVSCASAGNCVAVGGYSAVNGTTRPLLVADAAATWGAGVEPQPPVSADSSPDPNQPGVGAGLSLVACPAVGDCTAVGSFTNKDTGHGYYPWVVSESGGSWLPGAALLLPADAAPHGDPEVGPSPFFGFSGLSCPSVGNCTASGGYEDRNGAEEGLILKETDGVWSRAVKSPLPAKAVPHSEPNEFNSPLVSLSCTTPNDCSAVGWYVMDKSKTPHGLLLSERSGKWTASGIVLSANVKAPGGVFLTSVSCRSRGNCLAVGYYSGNRKTHGLIVRERDGKWMPAVNAALPKNAAAASKQHTFLNSVSCGPAKACLVGGDYKDRFSRVQGLLLNLQLR
jgi:hypothetical protein